MQFGNSIIKLFWSKNDIVNSYGKQLQMYIYIYIYIYIYKNHRKDVRHNQLWALSFDIEE